MLETKAHSEEWDPIFGLECVFNQITRALSAKVGTGFACGAKGGREATEVPPNNNLEYPF